MKVTIKKVSITNTGCEAVVNAANDGLWAGAGVCGAIFNAAGIHELSKECDQIGHCDTGSAVITSGYRLSRYIIHAVGPVWHGGNHHEAQLLYGAYMSSLNLCKQYNIRTVAFPLISAGIFGYPIEEAWRKALQACDDFAKQNIDLDITFAVLDDSILKTGIKVQQSLQSNESRIELTGPAVKTKRHVSRIEVFEDTKYHYENDEELILAVKQSKDATRFYDENANPQIYVEKKKTEITVTRNRSFEAAQKLTRGNPDKRVAVLNFASAVQPGGGVTYGCSAQEECLCRCSTLYPTLNRRYLKEKYYSSNKKKNDRRNTDAIIYTPDIVVFKTDTTTPELMERKDWYMVDVLSCAAPDLREIDLSKNELYQLHVSRATQILKVAAANHVDILVLGAFGCGAFYNDPEIVAQAYRDVLSQTTYGFEKIEFAIYCSEYNTVNYDVFNQIIN